MPTDAVLIAFFGAVEAVAKLVTVAMEGQSPDQRATTWGWYVKDVARWRRIFGIDAAEESKES